jgi:hypothetical protein
LKGRSKSFGERHRCAKLTDDIVIEARKLRGENSDYWTCRRLIEHFKVEVSETSMYKAVTGETWRKAGLFPQVSLKSYGKINSHGKKAIIDLWNKGYNRHRIARELQISFGAVKRTIQSHCQQEQQISTVELIPA